MRRRGLRSPGTAHRLTQRLPSRGTVRGEPASVLDPVQRLAALTQALQPVRGRSFERDAGPCKPLSFVRGSPAGLATALVACPAVALRRCSPAIGLSIKEPGPALEPQGKADQENGLQGARSHSTTLVPSTRRRASDSRWRSPGSSRRGERRATPWARRPPSSNAASLPRRRCRASEWICSCAPHCR